jgi:cell division protein FtsN
MGRIIRVVLYALVVLIFYFWFTAILKSCNEKNTTMTSVNNSIDTLNTQDTLLNENEFEFDYEEENNEQLITNEDIVSGTKIYDKIDQAVEKLSNQKSTPQSSEAEKNNPSPKSPLPTDTKPVSKPTNTSNTHNEDGQYYVIAGSYLKEENAKIQLKKLANLGYTNAKISVFNASEYHSVIVSKHINTSDADRVIQALRKKNIECFMKTKQ